MKVLFDCHLPFMLAHGGMQIQIEQTRAALERLGVEVEPLRLSLIHILDVYKRQ